MRILITGATGFIGRPLCRVLLERGHDVLALVRNKESAEQKLPQPVELFQWSGQDLSSEVLEDVDAIVHLAGEPVIGKRWSEERKREILDSRVATAKALVERIGSIKTFISGSAVGYYGDRGDEILTEQSGPGTGFLSEVCQKWEQVLEPLDRLGVRRAHLRTGLVLGQNGGALRPLLALFKTGLGGPIGGGKQWMSWIHLDDIVAQFVYLLEDGSLRGAFNGVSPHPLTNAQFTRRLAKALHKPAFMAVPAIALKILMGEMAETVLSSQRCVPKAFEAAGFKFKYEDLDLALKAICNP